MKRLLSFLLIPLSVLLLLAGMELLAGFITLPKNESGLEKAMDPWGISLFSCVTDEKLGYRLKPGALYGSIPINSLGYAGGEFTKAKGENVFRIVCIGGSTTFGAGASSANTTWPALLQSLFASGACTTVKRIEVINAGVPGYHSWHTMLRMEELDGLDPDMYILMDGFNDINASAAFKDSVFEQVEEKKRLQALVAKRDSLADSLAALFSKSKAFQVANWYARKWRAADHSQGLDDKIKAFNTENNLKAVLEHVQRSGRLAVMVNHPWSVHDPDPSKIASEDIRLISGYYIPEQGTVKAYMWGRNYVSRLNARLSSQFKVPLIDPQQVIDTLTTKKRDVYTVFSRDIIHFTDYGNSVLAGIVFQGLLSLPEFRQAVSAQEGCASAVPSDALGILRVDAIDWGSGFIRPVRTGVDVSIPVVRDVSDSQNEYEGWGVFRPASPSAPGSISFGVSARPGGERLLFFMPRIARNQGVVEVYLHSSNGRERIFRLDDFEGDAAWTQIAQRYMIDLSEVPDETYILEVVLTGKHAQLWHDADGNALFFR